MLPPDTAFSNITYSSPKVGPYEEIHSPDNIYSEPEHDNGNKYSEVSFNPTDVEAGIPTKVEYMELCDDAGVDETAPHEGVTSGNDVVRNSPYDNFVKEPVNSSSPSIELSSPLRNSGSNDDTILLDNELYSWTNKMQWSSNMRIIIGLNCSFGVQRFRCIYGTLGLMSSTRVLTATHYLWCFNFFLIVSDRFVERMNESIFEQMDILKK